MIFVTYNWQWSLLKLIYLKKLSGVLLFPYLKIQEYKLQYPGVKLDDFSVTPFRGSMPLTALVLTLVTINLFLTWVVTGSIRTFTATASKSLEQIQWKKTKTSPWEGISPVTRWWFSHQIQLLTPDRVCHCFTYFLPIFFPSAFSTGDIKVKQKVQQVLTSGSLGFCFVSISKTGCRSRTSWGNSGRKRL